MVQAKCRIPNGEKYKKKPFLWWKCPRIVSLSSAGGAIFGGRPRSDSELPKLSLRRFDHNSKVEEAMQKFFWHGKWTSMEQKYETLIWLFLRRRLYGLGHQGFPFQ